MNDEQAAPAPESTTIVPAEAKVTRALVPGTRLGRWVLVRTIGEGATATVWAARHEQLGAEVAIKVFHRQDLPFLTVLGEAKAAAGIPSRNVIWVYDVDTFEGHHAIVMELCAHGDRPARSLRDERPSQATEAARWIAEAARGLEAAHDGGVFHKDVKPANILLSPADGRAQITDFGLANPELWRAKSSRSRHSAQATVALDDLITAPATVTDPLAPIRGSLRVGTPEFMAPEQAAGLRRDLDGTDALDRRHLVAIDVYGLGATLWYLLVGSPPYPLNGADAEAMSVSDLMRQVAEQPVAPIRRVASQVPPRLAAIIDKAMHRDPLRRYPSAVALADDLDAWRTTYPTSLDRGPIVRGAVHVWRRRALASLLTVLALVTAGSSWIVHNNDTRIDAQSQQIEAQRLSLEEQQANFTALSRTHTTTNTVLAQTREKLNETLSTLDARTGAVHEREVEIADRDGQLRTLTEQLAAARAELTDADLLLREARDQFEVLMNERDAQAALVASTRRSWADTTAQLDRTSDALTKASQDNRRLGETVDDLEADIVARTARIAALEKADAASRAELVTLREQVEQARTRIRELRDENGRLRTLVSIPVPD